MLAQSGLRCTVDRLPAELQPHSLSGGGNLTTAKDGMGIIKDGMGIINTRTGHVGSTDTHRQQ